MKDRLSIGQLLVKIPNVPCLYRHKISGIHYGIKKHPGKRKEHSLMRCKLREFAQMV